MGNCATFRKGMIPWNKKEHIILTCQNCDKKFDVAPWESYRKYCSLQCTPQHKPRIEKVCKTCERQFNVIPANKDQIYCSSKCFGVGMNWGFTKGYIPWNKGEHVIIKCKTCGKEFDIEPNHSDRKYCSRACYNKCRPTGYTVRFFHRRPRTEEERKHISDYQQAHRLIGSDHFNYRDGGHRTERQKEMARYEYREWRTSIFERDNYTCQVCGQHGGYLQADHIKPWWLYPELRYDSNNGRTLCVPCHKKTGTWGLPSRNMVKEVCYV